jgi:hypothetical protein
MSTTAIKIVALVFMTIDNFGKYIPNMPIAFRYVGTLAIPLYFYVSSWEFYNTHHKRWYIGRVYKYGIGMCFLDTLLPMFLDNSNVKLMDSNIFASMMLAYVIIYLIEITKHRPKVRLLYLTLFTLYQILTYSLYTYLELHLFNQEWYKVVAEIYPVPKLLQAVLPMAMCSIVSLDVPLYLTALMPILYYSMHDRYTLVKNYTIYSLGYYAVVVTQAVPRLVKYLGGILNADTLQYVRYCFSALGFNTTSISIYSSLLYATFNVHYSWMMVLAVVPMLLYSGDKGRVFKKYFYRYYPIHVAVLYILGAIVGSVT